MTREEAIKLLYKYTLLDETYPKDDIEAFEVAIKALEQESCEDCISRQEVLDIIDFEDKWLLSVKGHTVDTAIAFSGLTSKVKALPSVAPSKKVRVKIYGKYE